ncbi:unnamed protein product, partial [Pylaiella littoralis]
QDDNGAGGTLSTPATPPMIYVTRSLRPALAAEGFECGGCAEPVPASGNKNAAGSAVEEWDRPESFEFLREFVSNTENTRGPLSDRSALKNAQQPHRPVAEHEYPVRGTPAAATGSAKSPRPPSPISSPKPALALRGGDHLSACSGARGPGGAGEAGAVDGERAGGVQAGGGTGRPRALSEDGVLARSCRSFGVEGGLESMEEDSADVKGFSALAAALEGSSSSLSPSSSSSSVAAATSTSQLPLNLVDGGHTIVLLDLETTGLRPKTDRVIQLAAKVMGSRAPNHVFSVLVDPEGMYICDRIRELTGITPRVLAKNNARPFREVWPRFKSWLATVAVEVGGGIVLAAHNATFDRGFLHEEIHRARLGGLTIARAGVMAFVDTLSVLRDRATWRQSDEELNVPPQPKAFKLGGLFEHVFGREMPGAHTAIGDVEGLEGVLSAPGISGRWRQVASTNPSCQIPVLPPLEDESQPRTKNTTNPLRARKPSKISPRLPGVEGVGAGSERTDKKGG